MRENRQYERSAAIIKVNYSTHGALKMDYAQNISRGGLFLATQNTFEMNQEIELHLRCSGLDMPIPVPGKVRWIGERGVPPVQGIGVQFTLEDPKVRARIEYMVDRLEAPEEVLEKRSEDVLVYILDENEFAAQMYAEGIQKMVRRGEGDITGKIQVERFTHRDQLRAALDAHMCDVLITELQGESFNGVQLIKDVRMSYGEILPIFAVSRSFPRDRYEALEAGASAFLNKPLQMRTLFNTLMICLQDTP
jgi:type IV pilus assembly protein PilZ